MAKNNKATKAAGGSKSATVAFLGTFLADTYTLQTTTQYFHWNVTGPHFHDLHKLFEGQYDELAEAVDVLAERIRALQAPAPGTFKQFLELATLTPPQSPPSWKDMVTWLLNAHEALAASAKEGLKITDAAEDSATNDLLVSRLEDHDKAAWMFRSILE